MNARIVVVVFFFCVAGFFPACLRADCRSSDPECNALATLLFAPIARTSLALGDGHSCALTTDGKVRCWGQALNSANGAATDIGGAPGQIPPAPLDLGGPVVQIAAGGFHTCALLGDGGVRCFGNNSQGQLGYGDTVNRPVNPGGPPPLVAIGGRVAQLALGESHSCALMIDGGVRCWGANASGQLGQGTIVAIGDNPGEMPPPPIDPGGPAIAIAAGNAHVCALMTWGGVRCWGAAGGGRIGTESANNIGDNPGEMPPASDVKLGDRAVEIGANETATCARLASGAVKCFGDNSNGQLGLNDTLNRGDTPGSMPPPDVLLGGPARRLGANGTAAHFCAILVNDETKCWGFNSNGQLGLGSTANIGDDPGEMPPPSVALNLPYLMQIAPGGFHTCAVNWNETVRCAGAGGVGQLGYGDPLDRGGLPGQMPPPEVSYRLP